MDLLVLLEHPLFHRGSLDEPTVERIIKHWFIGAPTVGISVMMFGHLKGPVRFLQFNGDLNIDRFVVFREFLIVIFILDEFPCHILHFWREATFLIDQG